MNEGGCRILDSEEHVGSKRWIQKGCRQHRSIDASICHVSPRHRSIWRGEKRGEAPWRVWEVYFVK
jgi:hypothetical protein